MPDQPQLSSEGFVHVPVLAEPLLEALAAKGASLREMAQALAGAGRRTRNGQSLSPTQVRRLLDRLGLS